jgi:hypothetical protein
VSVAGIGVGPAESGGDSCVGPDVCSGSACSASGDVDGIKVFSATSEQDRNLLGRIATAWLREHPHVEVSRTLVTQSSSGGSHCVTVTLLCKTRDEDPDGSDEDRTSGPSIEAEDETRDDVGGPGGGETARQSLGTIAPSIEALKGAIDREGASVRDLLTPALRDLEKVASRRQELVQHLGILYAERLDDAIQSVRRSLEAAQMSSRMLGEMLGEPR